MQTWLRNLATIATVVSVGQAMAVPSGLSRIPALTRPEIDGKTMPVDFLGDDKDPKTIWVVPTEATFNSQGIVKSPAADCKTLKNTMQLEKHVSEMRLQLAQMYAVAQTEYAKRQADMRKLSEQISVISGTLDPLRATITKLKTRKTEIVAEIVKVKSEIEGLNESKLLIDKNPSKVAEIDHQIAQLDANLTDLKRNMIAVGKQVREKDNAASDLEVTLAEATAKSNALDLELNRIAERIVKNKTTIEEFQKNANEAIKMYSKRLGAYAAYVFDFTPSRYLEALQKANDGYTFRYVNSRTASVVPVLPINTLPGSPLAEQDGQMILRMGWSNPQFAATQEWYRSFEALKTLPKELLEGKNANDLKELMKENPVLRAQEAMKASSSARVESSLSGSKFLGLELSVIGFCALTEPASLESEQIGGAQDAFKLAMHFTYPVHYNINVNGEFNHLATLYELHKMTKSSSWFGLSKKQKHEHVKRMTNDTTVKVRVDAPGSDLTLDETTKLMESVRTQLVYYTAEPYLDNSQTQTKSNVGEFDDKESGASSTGKRLMRIPNPWAWWGGMVLISLGEMFGSDEKTSESTVTASKAVHLDYQGGYTIMHSGDITVGNLAGKPQKVDNELR